MVKLRVSELSWAPVAHTYNPSYLRGRDEEDHGLMSPGQIVPWDSKSKKPLQKRAGGVARGEGPEVKPQYHQKKITSELEIGE
jgi:hypothetical protein